jgi:hypothetical protein
MISFNFNILNPWSNTFKNLWCRGFDTPFKNKFIEIEITKGVTLISCIISWTLRQSHAGLELELGLFGYNVHFNFYDNRHWDYARGEWEKRDNV